MTALLLIPEESQVPAWGLPCEWFAVDSDVLVARPSCQRLPLELCFSDVEMLLQKQWG